MDNQTARKKLSELRDSINQVLGNKSEGPSREDAEDALKAAREGAKRAKKSLLGRVKDLPVVDKITQLGAAGTVAVSTAAVTQTNIAVDETEVFVASVANDVVEQRFYVPAILDRLVDFPSLDSWGQKVMQEKVAEVQAEAAKVQAKVASIEASEESQTTEETESQKPQAQEEGVAEADQEKESAVEVEQDAEEVEDEKSKEVEEVEQSSEENATEEVTEEDISESVDEIDEIKPHSDVESDESGMILNPEELITMPDNELPVSPEGPIQI